jgi:hypothetical protein
LTKKIKKRAKAIKRRHRLYFIVSIVSLGVVLGACFSLEVWIKRAEVLAAIYGLSEMFLGE